MSLDELAKQFGTEVSFLVDGVTKLTQLSWDKDKVEIQMCIRDRPGGDHRVAEQQAVRADLPGGRFKGAAEKVPVVENAQAAR